MRFPSGLNGPCSDERVYLKKSQITHTSRTIYLICSPTTTLYYSSHYSGGSLKVTGPTIQSLSTIQTTQTIVTQWLLDSPYVLLEDVTLLEPSASRSFVNFLHRLHVKNVLEAYLIGWGMGNRYHAGCHKMVSSSGSLIKHSSLPILRLVRVRVDVRYL
jgi:hypothetical protein